MIHVVLFEDSDYANLMPLVHWRPVMELRCGRHTQSERIAALTGQRADSWVRPALRAVTASRQPGDATAVGGGSLLINARWLAESLPPVAGPSVVGMHGDHIAYVRCDRRLAELVDADVMLDAGRLAGVLDGVSREEAAGRMVCYPWDLIEHNGAMLNSDWPGAAKSAPIPDHVHVIESDAIHVAPKAALMPGVVLNAGAGPIHIDRHATIMPNAVIEGPSSIGPYAHVAAGAWIRGSVTVGPHCKVGGEVAVSILHGYSNKAHHGFLGHSVLGAWVNFGAGTTTSNLKNTYGEISVALRGTPIRTGQQFIGSIVADFAKTGINQALTTGCVMGFASMIATGGMSSRFIPSFRFITASGDQPYDLARCREVAKRVMSRRQIEMTPAELAHFDRLPEITQGYEGG